MKSGKPNLTKELYQQLRALSWSELWDQEVARFNQAPPTERLQRVALIRAVGVVFAESGPAEQQEEVRQWLRGLLQDPEEKIRRYAMAALPKLGSGTREETDLLALLQNTDSAREKKFLAQSLDKIGGAATLDVLAQTTGLSARTEQKVKANVLRDQSPTVVRLDRTLQEFAGLRIFLRGRRGLEGWVREEVEAQFGKQFRVLEVRGGLVVLSPLSAFSLGDVYRLRCFGTVGLGLGTVQAADEDAAIDAMAALITGPLARRVFQAFTDGPIRYRLDFVAKGHQRGAVRRLAERAYALCPDILNDARHAPWAIDIHPAGRGDSVELRPRLSPDPRYYYRQDDVPAASHPPLAACLARLAGKLVDAVVWDPFCGSGSELIERALLGGVRTVYGTDRSAEAIAITEQNFSAARLEAVEGRFQTADFRDFAEVRGLGPGRVDLIITNPPMGMRVPVPNLRGLIDDLLAVAARALRPGGRLVFANPMKITSPDLMLKLRSRQVVDLGGFECRVELYEKLGQPVPPGRS